MILQQAKLTLTINQLIMENDRADIMMRVWDKAVSFWQLYALLHLRKLSPWGHANRFFSISTMLINFHANTLGVLLKNFLKAFLICLTV
jgi:hypothetical protein